ncbi:caspase domain-containing protein [Aspergillus navahoensis]
MPSTNRALLIACPYGDLEGPERDAEAIAQMLALRQFQISRCCGMHATRKAILAAWRELIEETREGDAVVIFYSGHGGVLVPDSASSDALESSDPEAPWQYQFIVPMDFDPQRDEFSGILEIELSQLLLATTAKTRNVTVIMDCCHSGRMVRDPELGTAARYKRVRAVNHKAAYSHIKQLRHQGELRGRRFAAGNSDAVRIAATAPWEEAAELPDIYGQYEGVLTKALVQALRESEGQDVSWKTTMAYVTELVNARSPRQRPWVSGPQTRFLFSLEGGDSGVLPVTLSSKGSNAVIKCGRVGGVREGNKYKVMPPGSERVDDSRWIANATVTQVLAFEAHARVDYRPGYERNSKKEMALAFLEEEALHSWPVVCRAEVPELRRKIEGSRFLRLVADGTGEDPLIVFDIHEQSICLQSNLGTWVAWRPFMGDQPTPGEIDPALRDAEIFARARHLLSLQSSGTESLKVSDAEFEIHIDLVENDQRVRAVEPTGTDTLDEEQCISIALRNNHPAQKLYVTIFSVEVNGKIFLFTDPIHVPPLATERRGDADDEGGGFPLEWPDEFPRRQPVAETLVFVISDTAVDLSYLETPDVDYSVRRKGEELSHLDEVMFSLAFGHGRRVGPRRRVVQPRWQIRHFSFLVRPLDQED